MDRRFLQPGEMLVAEAASRVKTVLGSCVAITMRDGRRGLAAICHCLLPAGGGARGAEAWKYVDTTVPRLVEELLARGAEERVLEVKVFGGADSSRVTGAGALEVGRRNVEAALEGLAARRLAVAAQATGGRQGRVIDFNTATGEVLVKMLPLVEAAGGPR